MNTDDNPLSEDILHFVVPDSTASELFRRLGYALPPSDASDLMVYEVAEMTGTNPQTVFNTLLDISESTVEVNPVSEKTRIEQLEEELAETRRLVDNIPKQYTMEPKQRMAQSAFAMIVTVVIFLLLATLMNAQKQKADIQDRFTSEVSR